MTILWDWNGTLLDDVDTVVEMTDRVFRENGYGPVTRETYQSKFRHPIREYYRDMGVTDEEFDRMANTWSREYVETLSLAPLRQDAIATLERLRDAGWKHVIVSASENHQLRQQLSYHPGLTERFDALYGLGDIYAVSKVQLAQDFLRDSGEKPEDCVFIGDTNHDAEVARAAGIPCILVLGGHQTRERVEATGCPVVESLTQAADRILAGEKL